MPRKFQGEEILNRLKESGGPLTLGELEKLTKMSRSSLRHSVKKLETMEMVDLLGGRDEVPPSREIRVKLRDTVMDSLGNISCPSGVYVGGSPVSRRVAEAVGSARNAGAMAVLHRLCGSDKAEKFELS